MRCVNIILDIYLIAACGYTVAQETITTPAQNKEIDPSATVIYSDAVVGTRLQIIKKENSQIASSVETLSASTDKPADRLVIEIDGQTLYVHHREDFEKGHLYWGRMSPLDIVKGSAKQGILAYGFSKAPKSATVSAVSLNRMSGVGLWTLTKDTLWAKNDPRARDYPDATAMYLSCGSREK